MVTKPNPYLIDDENPAWSDEQLERAILRRAEGVKSIGQRGLQKAPTKQALTLRLDKDVIEKFKATGAGWQSRMNEALRVANPA